MLPAARGEIACASPAMGEFETSGILGAYVDSVGEKFCNEASLGGTVISDFMRVAQGTRLELLVPGEVSPVVKELKLALEVSGIAGLSCDGQEGKLAEVLGQIVAKKHGKEVEGLREFSNLSLSARLVGGSNQQVRVSRIINEA